MRILFVVPYVPSLIRTRPFNLLRSLANRGHQITLCTLWSDEGECQQMVELKQFCQKVEGLHLPRWRSFWNCVLALPARTPLQAVYCWQPELARLLDTLVTPPEQLDFDVVHVEHLRGARYAIRLKSQSLPAPVVWDSVDCISYLFEQASRQSKSFFGRFITRLELNRTRLYEGRMPGLVDHVLITSAIDRNALLSLADGSSKSAPVSLLPNGVDYDYFSAAGDGHIESATIVLSGKMSYHANVTMALYLVSEIMPRVWAQRPDVKLNIVGKDPPAEIQSLAGNPAITVTGTVPDIRPYIHQATAAVVPMLYGAGSQLKVLEAMACGTPVVATPQTLSALTAKPGQDVLVAQSPDDFARCILDLIDDREFRSRVGEAGREYVAKHHRWSAIAAHLEEIYSEAILSKNA